MNPFKKPRVVATVDTLVQITAYSTHKLSTPLRFVRSTYRTNKTYQLIQAAAREAAACPDCSVDTVHFPKSRDENEYCTKHHYVYWSIRDNYLYEPTFSFAKLNASPVTESWSDAATAWNQAMKESSREQ